MASFKLVEPKGRELLGGDLLAQSLKQLDVNTAFGLHGGHLDAFLIGAHDIGIKLVDTRHETVSVQAAEGYARVSGKVGVCFVTANSGFCNGLPGLATAFADRSPVFCITSSPPLRDAETNALQGFHDQVVVSKPMTKFAHRITNAEEIPRTVALGFRTAVSGAPGPVLIDFPIDVLFSPVTQSSIAWGAIARPLPYPPGPHPAAIAEAVKLWKAAERPVIISGTGARFSEAGPRLESLAESTKTPVFHSMKFSTPLSFKSPVRGGPASLLATLPYQGKKRPDFVLLLGARTGFLMGGRGGAILPNENCKLVQVDIDGTEIGRSHPIDVGIISDAAQALAALSAEVEKAPFNGPEGWLKEAVSLKESKSPFEDDPPEATDGRPHPHHAMKKFLSYLEPGAIIVTDGGECGLWYSDNFELGRPSLSMNSTGYLGFLGNGWGYALGTAIADPSRQVINLQGDGSAGFHIAELETYARFKLKILTVVFNNYVWGMSQAGQELIYGEKNPARPVSALSPSTEYDVVAKGFGCAGAKVSKLSEIEHAVKELTAAGPSCLNLIISNRPIAPGTKAMVLPTDDPNVIVVPYYDNLPRPYFKSSEQNGVNDH